MAWLWLLVGPNGSGKSTLARSGVLQRWSPEIPRHAQSPDDIARILPDVAPGGDEFAYVRAAQAASDALVQAAVEARRTIMVETVGSSPKFFAVVDDARDRGMRFGLIYVTVKAGALNLARVAQRVATGGHQVPADRVVDRRARSIANFPEFARRANAGLVLDNSLFDPATVDGIPRMIAEKRPLGTWRILDPVTAPYLTDALADLG
jgi:predicted ABC-type ATPase